MRFEWDPTKDRANQEKHGLSFNEASALFESDVDYLEIYDGTHSEDEERFIAIGPIDRGIVVVVYTERIDDVTRIISARPASKVEIERYRRHLERTR
jgi:uncharacterized DUF497 family protein